MKHLMNQLRYLPLLLLLSGCLLMITASCGKDEPDFYDAAADVRKLLLTAGFNA